MKMEELSAQLREAFCYIVCFGVPEAEDVIVEIDGTRMRTTKLLNRIAEVGGSETLPVPMCDLLGLPVRSTYAMGVSVYRANSPKPRFPQMARGNISEMNTGRVQLERRPLDHFRPERLRTEVRERVRLNGDG